MDYWITGVLVSHSDEGPCHPGSRIMKTGPHHCPSCVTLGESLNFSELPFS